MKPNGKYLNARAQRKSKREAANESSQHTTIHETNKFSTNKEIKITKTRKTKLNLTLQITMARLKVRPHLSCIQDNAKYTLARKKRSATENTGTGAEGSTKSR